MMFDFVDGAAGNETAARLNRESIDAIRLQPRVLVNVEDRTTATRLLDFELGLPFGVAPMGMCNLTWPGADSMLARQAVHQRIPICVSCAGSTSLEEMNRLAGSLAWFQLYVGESRDAAFDMVARAETAGFEVLILTVDVPQVAKRIRDQKNGFQVPFKWGPKQFADFFCHPRWSIETLLNGVPSPVNYARSSSGRGFVRNESRGSTDWVFLRELRERWPRKLIVKGVLHPADAAAARKAGVDAIYVSNHGGRQLDAAPPAIHALPAIRSALGAGFPLIFDSGVRSGEGVVKALAMGADFVMLGRPFMYAIGADGERGLSTLMHILREEISVTLAQLGLRDIRDVDSGVISPPLNSGESDG